jgi:hypothetical protein
VRSSAKPAYGSGCSRWRGRTASPCHSRVFDREHRLGAQIGLTAAVTYDGQLCVSGAPPGPRSDQTIPDLSISAQYAESVAPTTRT